MSVNSDQMGGNLGNGGGTTRNLLPYTPPVGNQVVAEQKTVVSAATKQAQQSVQLTDYTWIEQTTGVGVGAFTVLFDVAFTQEPVVSHGMTLPDFAAEIRADVDAATGKAADAQAAASAFQWTFPGNITVGTFQPYNDGEAHQESTPYKFSVLGITNSTNSGKKMSIVFAYPDGSSATATFHSAEPRDGRTLPTPAEKAVLGQATISLPNKYINDDLTRVTWRLLADGTPVTATGGFDTSDIHRVQILTQAEITARKAIANAAQGVGNTLELGGDASAFPLCNVYVKRWILNNQNNYIGADCIVVVKTFGVTSTPEPTPPTSEEPQAS